jgi:hypothetical protein
VHTTHGRIYVKYCSSNNILWNIFISINLSARDIQVHTTHGRFYVKYCSSNNILWNKFDRLAQTSRGPVTFCHLRGPGSRHTYCIIRPSRLSRQVFRQEKKTEPRAQRELKQRVSVTVMALFCWSCFSLFQLVLVYSLSHNTIELAETSRLFHRPNQPYI